MRSSSFVRLSAYIVLAICTALLASCSWIKVKDVPSPYEEDIVLGKVIKEIRIEGNETTKESIILTAMASKVGDVYTEDKALLDGRRLYGLGVFISVRFETIDAPGGVILVVQLQEVSPYIPAPSVKITEENGLEIGAMLSSSNLFGSATRLSAYARFGGATNVGVKFKDPWLPGQPYRFGATTIEYAHMERKNKVWDFDEKSDDFFYLFTRNITNQLRWGPKLMLLSVRSKEPGITLDPDNHDTMYGAGLFMQADNRNLIVYPTKGWFTEVLLAYMGGVADYWQSTFDVRRYTQLAGDTHSLSFYSLLTMTSGKVGVDIPVYQQFAIGGSNTVRGWDLGERLGKNQWLNTLEYWFLWREPKSYEVWFIKQAIGLQLALLADVGTAWATEEEFHQHWIFGGGAGIRVTIPSFVMFRVDFAYGQSGLGVGLYIGSGEKAEAQRQRVR